MTNDEFDLSRRKILGGVATIGAAGALGGAGTLAFFSDEEEFANNQLTAGEFDLKVDWSEHYSDWSDDEADNVDVSMDPVDGYTPLPTPLDPMLWVDNADQFLVNTAIEAYPDSDNNAQQDPITEGEECDELVNADLDEALSSDLRTEGTFGGDPNPQTTESGDPLVNITDIKPGDFGEVTLSFHLCDNPGFIWLQGELLENAENGLTEPESKDPDENGGEPGELGREILVSLWYDDGGDGFGDGDDPAEGDNVMQEDETIIAAGSLQDVMDILNTGDGIPLDGNRANGAGGGVVPTDDGTNGGVLDESDCNRVQGNPNCADLGQLRAIKIESGDLPPAMVGESDTYSTPGVPGGEVTVTVSEVEDGEITCIEFQTNGFAANGIINKGGNFATVCEPSDGVTSGEVCAPENLQNPNRERYEISHVSFCFTGEPGPENGDGGGGQQEDGRDCFPNSTTGYIGFAWWLPLDHGNEVQGDSVAFDLGFYAEQCRHNDGSGQFGNTAAGGST